MPIDFSPLYGPTPSTGITRGNKFFGDALEAVLERRNRLQQEQMQQEAANQRAAAQNKLMQGYYDQLGEQERNRQAETGRHNLQTEATARAAAEQNMRTAHGAALKQAADAAEAGFAPLSERIMAPWAGYGPGAGAPAADPEPGQAAPPATPPPPVNLLDVFSKQAPVTPPAQAPMDATYTGAPPAASAAPPTASAASPSAPPAATPPSLPAAVSAAGPKAIDWAAMSPRARIAEFRRGVEQIGLPPPLQRLLPELEVGVATGAKPLKEALDYLAAERESLRRAENTRVASRGAGERADRTARHQERTAARSDMALFLEQKGYKADQVSYKQFDRMEAIGKLAAESGPGKNEANAIAANAFMGMYTKFAQGEVGVLTESDLNTFWKSAGSPAERTEEALERILSGGLGEAKRLKALEAIGVLKQTIKSRLEELRVSATDYMVGEYGDEGRRHVNAFFGKGPSMATPARTGGKEGLSPEEREAFKGARKKKR